MQRTLFKGLKMEMIEVIRKVIEERVMMDFTREPAREEMARAMEEAIAKWAEETAAENSPPEN